MLLQELERSDDVNASPGVQDKQVLMSNLDLLRSENGRLVSDRLCPPILFFRPRLAPLL